MPTETTAALSFPAFVIVHPLVLGVVFEIAHTKDQAEAKLARLKETDPAFEILPNGDLTRVPPEPTDLQKIVAELVADKGSELGAHEAIYDVIWRPKLVPPPPAPAPEVAPIEEIAPVLPPDCPFKFGDVVQDVHSGSLVTVRRIEPALPSGTLGMYVEIQGLQNLHWVPAVNYPDFVLPEKAATPAPDQPKAKTPAAPAAKKKPRAKPASRIKIAAAKAHRSAKAIAAAAKKKK